MAEPIDEYFTATVPAMSASERADLADSSLTVRECLALFDAQLGSRHLDLAARWLRSQGKGYYNYTIGSSGHEGNAAVAFSTVRAHKLRLRCPWPRDAITVCSFGDASVNHSTAVGAINTALHSSDQGVPMPLLLVCEDNGIGISVKSPRGWIEQTYGNHDGLMYFDADGSDQPATFDTSLAAAAWVRTHRRPAFLHLRMVRLMGHAGSDYEPAYRRPAEIAADYDRDPVLCTANC